MCEDRVPFEPSTARIFPVPSNSPKHAIQSSLSSPILTLPRYSLPRIYFLRSDQGVFSSGRSVPPDWGMFAMEGCRYEVTPEIWARIWIRNDLSLDRITVEEQERLRKYLGRAKSFPLSVEIILKSPLGASVSTMERFTLLRVLTEKMGYSDTPFDVSFAG
ncbi:hypothetical protein L218DRAFT_958986 [Marasmius fiardii PR-910]|nr:hypothetical protein L218DRAFT_958986 [Marasmius fiardii PR-910]